jgi:hypothetical protein
MSNYFSYFPKTPHDLTKHGQRVQLTNILRRFKVSSVVANRTDAYYTYDIQEGDRPDTIAEKYYGNANYAWLVLHFNDIEDVRFDWPLSTVDFEAYIAGKYGSLAAAQAKVEEYRIYLGRIEGGQKVPATAKTLYDGTRLEERVVVVDETTYNATASNFQKAAVSSYDFEAEKNETKRSIRLLDKRYLGKVRDEVEDILRNGV